MVGMRRRNVHCYAWTGDIARNQQPDQDHRRTQAGCDQAKEQKVRAVV